ncbi:DUF6896 domain-containing protein [Novipirellula herctigrandis]
MKRKCIPPVHSNLYQILKHRLNVVLNGGGRDDLHLQTLIESPIGLSPWDGWLVLCLIRHRGRQQFLLENMRARLDGDPEVIARAGAMGHPDRPRVGLVPGDTDWEYRFHGRGCCMTHRVTGEDIDVDFHDETADWIGRYFFVKYLESLQRPTFVEKRICELYPSARSVNVGIDELFERGILEAGEYGASFRLAIPWEELCDLLDQIEWRWHQAGTQTLAAAAMSDWARLSEARADLADRADACLREKCDDLQQRFLAEQCSSDALTLLADLNAPNLEACLGHALKWPPSGVLSAAIDIVERKSLSNRWSTQLREIVNRVDPNGELPSPYIWNTALKLLIRLHPKGDLEKEFLRLNRNELSEAAMFAMEMKLPCAINLIRRSLRSVIPNNRIEMAAVLAIIDLPWCHDELACVLAETSDQEMTTECRTALLESRDVGVHAIVHNWEADNPYDEPDNESLTIGDLAKQRRDVIVQFEMQTLHDRIIILRDRFKPGAADE